MSVALWGKCLQLLEQEDPNNHNLLSEDLNIKSSHVIQAVRNEMACKLEDVLARRTRALFLDAPESLRIAPETARLMANELGRDEAWISSQLDEFSGIARKYIVH